MIKRIPKILTCLFVIIFVLQLISLLVLVILPAPGQAADVQFKPQVGIGEGFETGKAVLVDPNTIGKYIKAIYMYATGIVGILATVVLMFGGISWIAAGGNAQRVDNAKSWITAALTGLFLAMGSYMILNTINPKLVELQPIKPTKPDKLETGCCAWDPSIGSLARITTKSFCDGDENEPFPGTFYPEYYPLNYYCYSYTTLTQPCNETDKKCKPPLDCLKTLKKCTDGQEGSLCDKATDCHIDCTKKEGDVNNCIGGICECESIGGGGV